MAVLTFLILITKVGGVVKEKKTPKKRQIRSNPKFNAHFPESKQLIVTDSYFFILTPAN